MVIVRRIRLKKKTVLFLTTGDIYPGNAGGTRYLESILQFLKEKGLSVTLLYFSNTESIEAQKYYENLVEQHYWVEPGIQKLPLNLSLSIPAYVKMHLKKAMLDKITEIDGEAFDYVVFGQLYMSIYARYLKHPKKYLIEQNYESRIFLETCTSRFLKLCKNWQYSLMEKYEINILKNMDAIFAISDDEAVEFRRITEKPVIPLHPVFNPMPVRTEESLNITFRNVMFVGSLFWEPNKEAANWLVNKFMPTARKKGLNIILYIVGRDPGEDLIEVGKKYEDIIVTGGVPSIDPYYKKCDLFINAVFSGGGLNIKLVEAMAKGIPVLSSIYGCRGTKLRETNAVEIFCDENELVQKVEDLLENPSKRIKLVKEAKEFCHEYFTPCGEFCECFEIK